MSLFELQEEKSQALAQQYEVTDQGKPSAKEVRKKRNARNITWEER